MQRDLPSTFRQGHDDAKSGRNVVPASELVRTAAPQQRPSAPRIGGRGRSSTELDKQKTR